MSNDKTYTFLLFDAAAAEDNYFAAKELNPQHTCLYKGAAAEDLEAVAPYLFDLNGKEEFNDWYHSNGFGNSWGFIVQSSTSFDEVYDHFRQFLKVKTESGEQLYFRFYDPRVLKIFLPTCSIAQVIEFFGPIDKFVVEGETNMDVIEYTHDNGVLNTKSISVSASVAEPATL